jgi:ferritin-like metal-binding protein YciE
MLLSTTKKTTMKKNGTAKKSATKSATKKSSSSAKSKSVSASDGLKKIFEEELKDIYWAEKHLTKALPKMAKAAESEELSAAFEEHLEQTEGQVERLEQVFDICGIKAQAKKCEAMEGLVEEAQEMIEEHDAGVVRDSGLIIAAQKVEHYEMAAYGSLRTLAQVLGFEDAVELLQETLDEEGETDKNLTALSESINAMALEESEEGVEDEEEEMA